MFFGGMPTLLTRPGGFRPFPTTCYRSVSSRPVPIAIEDCETVAAELRRCQPGSGSIAEPPVEFCHCSCGTLLVLGRKVLAIAAYLPAAHLERFGIAHIARMENV
jgi:hypothetical protein